MWKVPLFDTSFDDEEVNAVEAVVRSGWLTMGERTLELEEAFAESIGVRHAIASSHDLPIIEDAATTSAPACDSCSAD